MIPQENQNPVKVWISDGGYAFAIDSISITMGLKYGPEQAKVMRIEDDGRVRFDDVEHNLAVNPTVQLPHDFARALLEALTRYYQGASDMHTVRGDLLHERGRVDKLTDALISLANFRFNNTH